MALQAAVCRLLFGGIEGGRAGVILQCVKLCTINAMNNNLMLKLTENEMLELWKTRMQLLPARRDCVIEREDGIDIDAVLLFDIREWYAGLLTTGRVDWLPVDDLRNEVRCEVDDEGVVTAALPTACVRPVEWRLSGWERSVTRFYRPDSYEALCQRNIYMRGDAVMPVAVLHDDRLVLYSLDPGTASAEVSQARCVALGEDGTYRFSEAALPTIEDFIARRQ